MSTTISINPAAGPDTCKEFPENAPTTIPPIIPEIIPEYIGNPQAMDIPIASGSATRNTMTDAKKSFFIDVILIINV